MTTDPLAGLSSLSSLEALDDLSTPAVLIHAASVDHNINRAIERLGAAQRWRAHIKTGRSRWAADRLMARGVQRFKASTTAELVMLLEAGARDVLLATPAVGPAANEVAALARRHPESVVSVLVDDPTIAANWPHRELTVVIDVDTGMGRTGVDVGDGHTVMQIIEVLRAREVPVGGLHTYDGHLAAMRREDRTRAVAEQLQELAHLIAHTERCGQRIVEVTVAGSHTFDCHVAQLEGRDWGDRVSFGPGTLLFNDSRSIERFGDGTYRAALAVATRVVSRRPPDRVTIDAGLTAIQVDAGHASIRVIGHPAVEVVAVNQEHTVLRWSGESLPEVGASLLLLPAHVDTTISQFAEVVVVEPDETIHTEPVVRRTTGWRDRTADRGSTGRRRTGSRSQGC